MTTKTNFESVVAFHEKFGVPVLPKPGFLDQLASDAQSFREKFGQEEHDEFVQASADKNLLLAYDSLIDTAWIAFGTAHMMGCTPAMWQELWNAVEKANMSKVRATEEDAKTSKRGSSLDILKPAGWVSPDVEQAAIIEKYSK